MEVHVINFSELKMENPAKEDVILTVSKSDTWSKGLSPFYLGPCFLYGGHVSENVENAWQFSKVYDYHMDGDEVSDKYVPWAEKGWADTWAHRYPMGKGKILSMSISMSKERLWM